MRNSSSHSGHANYRTLSDGATGSDAGVEPGLTDETVGDVTLAGGSGDNVSYVDSTGSCTGDREARHGVELRVFSATPHD